jgi:hypothetical protein
MRKFLVAVVAALAALPAMADPNLATAVAGRFGTRGSSNAFKLVGNLLYDADRRGLTVYDVSDPSHITELTSLGTDRASIALSVPDDVFLLTEGDVQELEVRSDRSIVRKSSTSVNGGGTSVAASDQWLAVADAMAITLWQRDGDNLRLAGRFPLNAVVSDLVIQGDRLYAAMVSVGVEVLDLTGGALAPLTLVSANAQGLALDGNDLYVAAGVDGLIVLDVSNASAPVTLSRTGAGELNLFHVAVANGRAYATEPDGHVVVFDLNAADGPVITAVVSEPAQAIAANATHFFVAGSLTDKFGVESFTGVAVHAFDVTHPGAPLSAGQFLTDAGPVTGVATDGLFAYVADPPFFRVVRINSPDKPQEVASIRIAGLQDHVRMQGRRVIVYGRGDVDLIDVSDVANPRLLDVWPSFGGAPSAAAFGRTTVLEGNSRSGFHVLDTTDPTNLFQISGSKGHYFEVQSFGDTAYIFDLGSMHAVDLRDTHNAVVFDGQVVSTKDAEVTGATSTHPPLLAASTIEGLRIFDLSDPLSPVSIGLASLPPSGVFALGQNTAYYAVPGALYQIDITNPGSPVVHLTDIAVQSPRQLSVSGNTLVVADAFSLLVFGPPGPDSSHRRAAIHR